MKIRFAVALLVSSISMSCHSGGAGAGSASADSVASPTVRLITLDPGHFHAALVQKSMYPDVDSIVHVYAPPGPDVKYHLDRINAYNERKTDPTHWVEKLYTGADYFQKMIADKTGNTVVLAGNNRLKSEYILQSLEAGFNVLADKPMAIDKAGFDMLKQAFDTARQRSLLLYDIMTERFEITTILQRELSMRPEVFGGLEKGDPLHPAVVMESVHHFYKSVSGAALTRPPWFFDTRQQGEGIVDVMTHLVDLGQWICFPGQALDYARDIQIDQARHWPAEISLAQFREITKLDSFPAYLHGDIVHDSVLRDFCNGQIDYRLRGVHIRTRETWTYQDPHTAEDTYYALLRGSGADLVIRQSAAEQYKPTLYVEPRTAESPRSNKMASSDTSDFEKKLQAAITALQGKYPGIGLSRTAKGWMVTIPDVYKEGHEAHFARVTQNFLEYIKKKDLPAWEVPDMIAKYYTTTKALEMALKSEAHPL